MKTALCVIVAFSVAACAATSPQKETACTLVGLWEETSPTIHAITLRKSDGTYERKQIQIYDYAKPPLTFESSGQWRVRGKHYVFDLKRVTAAIWQKYVGKQWNETILECDRTRFTYLSTDGATIEERRIGEASDAAFRQATVPSLAQSNGAVDSGTKR